MHHAPHPSPADRVGTYPAGLGGGDHGAAPEIVGSAAPAGLGHQVALGVAGAVALGATGVHHFQQHGAVARRKDGRRARGRHKGARWPGAADRCRWGLAGAWQISKVALPLARPLNFHAKAAQRHWHLSGYTRGRDGTRLSDHRKQPLRVATGSFSPAHVSHDERFWLDRICAYLLTIIVEFAIYNLKEKK